MDTDAIYSAVRDYGWSCRRRDAMDEVDHLLRTRMLLNEADDEHKSLLAENERLVDEVNEARKETSEQARLNGMGAEREARLMAENAELKAKLTEKASLLRGCYARINGLEKVLKWAVDYSSATPAGEMKQLRKWANVARAALENKHEG